MSRRDVLALLRQSSSALAYLHDQKPLIVHRDVKPENILVLSRSPFHIKLSDFGLAKAGSFLETNCGTPRYIAPEISRSDYGESRRYTCAVDIWSLGVVVLEYGYSLPRYDRNSRLSRAEQIIEGLKKWKSDTDGVFNVLSGMLVIDPKQRLSAKECLERAQGLEGSQTPTQTPRPMPSERQQREVEPPKPTAIDPTALKRPVSPKLEGDIRQQRTSRPIQDAEVQGHSKPGAQEHARPDVPGHARDEVPRHTDALTTTEKRKRVTGTLSSSERRAKRTVT
ncbi:kinase-like protein [Pseudovirgaria hyperparasitica]|uniref:Kinase-like protein n=1 Tax=Pseudovirgaria hyperparasitica TaxID=470096 RepID=A0A6A6W4G9_9PEZI|nr:kinase-like protein [Pseudovirgaria hyperparasitica]KAF2757513.1 kinase-like protein [Pseudovirgaria hyperparasitica]